MNVVKAVFLSTLLLSLSALIGCTQLRLSGGQYVLLGESFADGTEATHNANLAIARANSHGCEAVSVGGYGASGKNLVIGVPVLVRCPTGVQVDPQGNRRNP